MTNPHLPEPHRQQPFSAPPFPPAPLSAARQQYAIGMPATPYGVDPVTGAPLSDKSRVAAGLLQLLPGLLLGLGGIGRLYAGYTTLGAIQLAATVLGWVSFWCGFLLIFPFVFYIGTWLWFVIDGIVLLAGRSTDGQGRLMRS